MLPRVEFARNQLGEGAQQRIADWVAVPVIDELEVVEVKQGQCGRASGAAQGRQFGP